MGTDLRTAAQQALEALESLFNWHVDPVRGQRCSDAITALRTALEQEPRNQCGETCERAKLCAACARGLEQDVPETNCGNMEPLAWLESPYGSIRMNTTMRFQFPPQSLKWKIPLYTHPPRREPEQEPVAWTLTKTLDKRETTTTGYLWFSDPQNSAWTPLFTHPPRREWRGLTLEEVQDSYNADYQAQTRAIEAALKERNA